MFQRLFLTVLMISFSMLVSACSSVTPARFQRGFTVGGTIHETVMDADGEASHFVVTDSPMERLFTKYLMENPSSVLFVGFFFHQDKNGSGSGTGGTAASRCRSRGRTGGTAGNAVASR